jgi:ribosomal protein S21
MAVNIQIEKNTNENSVNMIKRFTRKVQGSGILSRVRSIRYSERSPSRYTKKKHALKVLARRTETARLVKLGKIVEKTVGRR